MRKQILKQMLTVVEVHSEDGAGAGGEGDADEEHLHEQVHLDDPVPRFVLVGVDVLPTKKSLLWFLSLFSALNSSKRACLPTAFESMNSAYSKAEAEQLQINC